MFVCAQRSYRVSVGALRSKLKERRIKSMREEETVTGLLKSEVNDLFEIKSITPVDCTSHSQAQAAISKFTEQIGDRNKLSELRTVFAEYDTNGDGGLDRSEFGRALLGYYFSYIFFHPSCMLFVWLGLEYVWMAKM